MKTDRSPTQEKAREKTAMVPGATDRKVSARRAVRFVAAAIIFAIGVLSGIEAGAAAQQRGFATPEEAVQAFVAAMRSNDQNQLLSIFGSSEKELISSGDPFRDKQRREMFVGDYERKNSLKQEGARVVLIIGEKDWPFPVPMVKKGNRWVFDTQAGKEEILNRRIGENELSTVQTLLAIVDAQREYAMKDRDGDGIREYAEKFGSDPGKRNGLYWEASPGEEPSPLGQLVANARSEGYRRSGPKQGPIPYHGYLFRILTRQGRHADGGAFDYLVKKNMVGGFAAVAYPAVYGNSGVMTFMVNHEGVVYEKNLGKNTAKAAGAMTSFDPDTTWKKAE